MLLLIIVYLANKFLSLLSLIEIDPNNFDLYRFKVGSFLRHSVLKRKAGVRMTVARGVRGYQKQRKQVAVGS